MSRHHLETPSRHLVLDDKDSVIFRDGDILGEYVD